MRKFLSHLIVFALCVFLLFLGVEFFLLRFSNEYTYKKKYAERNAGRIKTLILGHSQVSNGINPVYWGDSTFNMAIFGRNLYYDAVLAERYVPAMKNLECVIWSLGYNFEFDNFRYPCMKHKGDYSSTYRCMYEKYMSVPSGFPGRYWSEIVNSRFEYGTRMFKKDFFELNSCDSLGFELMAEAEKASGWKELHLPVEVDYTGPNAEAAFKENMTYLKRMAKVCRDAGVRLVVVTTPCYESFWQKTRSDELERMYSCVDTMRSVYPALEYYDFMFDKRFTEEDFSDASHLGYRGAEKFTRLLRDTCYGEPAAGLSEP